MERATIATPANLSLIEDYYQRWQQDPALVEPSWRIFFEGFDLGRQPAGAEGDHLDLSTARAQAAVTRLVDAYREFGHYLADLDPLKLKPRNQTFEWLDLSAFGLSEADLNRVFYNKLSDAGHSTLRRTDRDSARDVLPDHRRRVHAHPRHGDPQVAAGPDGADPEPPAVRHPEEAADHLQAQRGRAVRDVPAQALRRPEAVFARRGRDADPAARRGHRAGGHVRVSGRSSWACRTAAG